MKKLILGLIPIFLSILVFQNFSVHASAQDFIITDFQADYYLSKNDDNRSVLKTIEKITAQFPEIDQNHGIERALPTKYDNHTVKIKIISIVDEDDKEWSYSTYKNNDNLVLRIGDADAYVHGIKTYIITYIQQDVTKYYQNSNTDEFYWDVNGLEWQQPFNKVVARLHLDEGLEKSLSGNMSCYYGLSGSNKICNITKSQDYIEANVSNLNIGENMTIAVGFKPGTFSAYSISNNEWIEAHIVDMMLFLNAISIIIILIIKKLKARDYPGRGSIAPEYLPPKGANVLLSSIISKNTTKWTAASYVDLAVRHKIKILQDSKKTWGFENKIYKMEFIDGNGLDENEMKIISDIFGSNPKAGDQYEVEKMRTDYSLARSLRLLFQNTSEKAVSLGYYNVDKKLKTRLFIFGAFAPIVTIISWLIFNNSYINDNIGVLIFIAVVSIIISVGMITSIKPMSEKGRELFDYLKGLKMYIKLAEIDRLKVLQSPEGAQKTKVNTDDSIELVHLYERVLPYAIMFGLEKNWSKVLGEFYEKSGTQPDWYVSTGAFSAATFATVVSSFTNYASSTNSSTGGSSGGGSSGGGGGGGGGGGW
ncbi:MAG: DUF2207 domain-containing protein [Candidatus Saccharimonadales bacterium]